MDEAIHPDADAEIKNLYLSCVYQKALKILTDPNIRIIRSTPWNPGKVFNAFRMGRSPREWCSTRHVNNIGIVYHNEFDLPVAALLTISSSTARPETSPFVILNLAGEEDLEPLILEVVEPDYIRGWIYQLPAHAADEPYRQVNAYIDALQNGIYPAGDPSYFKAATLDKLGFYFDALAYVPVPATFITKE